MTVNETLEFARTIEKRGYRALWIPEAFGRDPFSHAAYLLSHCERLSVANGNREYLGARRGRDGSAARTVSENL